MSLNGKAAKSHANNRAELRQHTPMDTIRIQLKTLNRQQSLYSKTKTMMKNNLIALLDQTYPGVNALFDSPVREDGSHCAAVGGLPPYGCGVPLAGKSGWTLLRPFGMWTVCGT